MIGSRDVEPVLALFDGGWAQGDHMAIVASSTDAKARQMLEAKRLDALALEEQELVVAPIVGGAGILVAAATDQRLAAAINTIAACCRDAEIAFIRD